MLMRLGSTAAGAAALIAAGTAVPGVPVLGTAVVLRLTGLTTGLGAAVVLGLAGLAAGLGRRLTRLRSVLCRFPKGLSAGCFLLSCGRCRRGVLCTRFIRIRDRSGFRGTIRFQRCFFRAGFRLLCGKKLSAHLGGEDSSGGAAGGQCKYHCKSQYQRNVLFGLFHVSSPIFRI